MQQIKALLKQTATPVANNARLEGAGILNPVAATLAAKTLVVKIPNSRQHLALLSPNQTAATFNPFQGNSSSLVAQIPNWNLSTQSPHP
jgi:hypothetical protein